MTSNLATEIVHPYVCDPENQEYTEFAQLCAKAYGASLAPPDQFRKRMQRVTTLIRLRHQSGALAGAVALQRSRMTAFATSPDTELGPRSHIAQELGGISRQEGMEWCSIGAQHSAMLITASRLQLARVSEVARVASLLESDSLADTFLIDRDTHDLPTITTYTSIERQRPYPQQVWAWPLENDSVGAPTTIRT